MSSATARHAAHLALLLRQPPRRCTCPLVEHGSCQTQMRATRKRGAAGKALTHRLGRICWRGGRRLVACLLSQHQVTILLHKATPACSLRASPPTRPSHLCPSSSSALSDTQAAEQETSTCQPDGWKRQTLATPPSSWPHMPMIFSCRPSRPLGTCACPAEHARVGDGPDAQRRHTRVPCRRRDGSGGAWHLMQAACRRGRCAPAGHRVSRR